MKNLPVQLKQAQLHDKSVEAEKILRKANIIIQRSETKPIVALDKYKETVDEITNLENILRDLQSHLSI